MAEFLRLVNAGLPARIHLFQGNKAHRVKGYGRAERGEEQGQLLYLFPVIPVMRYGHLHMDAFSMQKLYGLPYRLERSPSAKGISPAGYPFNPYVDKI